MRGPFVLSKPCVNMLVPPRLLGVFALSNSRDSLSVVKRAQTSACDEIKSHFNQYKYFWFRLAATAREAFSIECEIYHEKLADDGNGNCHPSAPSSTGWHCPVCNL